MLKGSYIYCLKGYRFLFLDECAINTNFKPQYGYTLRNRPLRLNWVAPKSKNYSFIGTVDKDSLIGYKLIKGGTTGINLYEYLLDMVTRYNLDLNPTVFILDNLRGHKLKSMYPIVDKKLNLMFLPRYSPMLNSIEYVFSLLKRHLRKKVYSDVDLLIEEIGLFFENTEASVFQNIQNHCIRLMCDIKQNKELNY